jgi:hypothetical protein
MTLTIQFLRWKYPGVFLRKGLESNQPLGIHAKVEYIATWGSPREKENLKAVEEKAKGYELNGQKIEMSGPSGPHVFG